MKSRKQTQNEFNWEIEIIKKKKILELRNTKNEKNEMKISIAVISNRLDQTEEIICELEYRSFEIIHSEDN